MNDSNELSASLAFIARHLDGEQNRLQRLAEDFATQGTADPVRWKALVDRGVFCMQWALARLRVDVDGLADPNPCDVDLASSEDVPEEQAVPDKECARGQLLQGSASVIPLPDVLSLLFGMQKTGLLVVETENEIFEVQLTEGCVTYANSSSAVGNRLGETLVQLSILTERQLEEVLSTDGGDVLGKILIDEGIIEPAELETALTQQTRSIFLRVLEIDEARWRFEPGVRRVMTEDFRLNVIHLLLESASRIDERQRQSA